MRRYQWLALCAAGLTLGAAAPAFSQEGDAAKVFAELDANGDKKLEADEISEEQKPFFDRLLRVGDDDQDGVLTAAEYQSALKDEPEPGPDRPEGSSRFGGRRGERPEPGAMFERLDANKDGKLTRDELPEPLRDRMGQIFDRLGKDSLTRDDLIRAMGRFGGPGRPGGSDGMRLSNLDKNGDGKLQRSELPEGAQERLGRIFDRLGTDEVDIERVERMMAQFREGRGGEPRDGDRPEGARRPEERDRPPGDGPSRFRGPAFLRALDVNGDMQISSEELENATAKLKELDRNGDGVLDMPELMGFPEGEFRPPFGDRGPRGDRPEADRPRDGDRRPEGDRPREGDRRPDGERPRDGDRPEADRERREGFGSFGGFGGGRGPGIALVRELDADRNGQLSQEELSQAVSKLDRNDDGELDVREIMGFGGFDRGGDRPGFRGFGGGRDSRDGDSPERPDQPERPERPESE